MPQLNGVQTVSDSVIIHGADTYVKAEAPAQGGDIVRSDFDYSFMPIGTFYLINDYGDYFDNDGDPDEDAGKDGETTLFRRVAEPAVTPLSTAQLIEQKRAELAELERKLDAERSSLPFTVIALGDDSGDGWFSVGRTEVVA